jgi:hypothetical protein
MAFIKAPLEISDSGQGKVYFILRLAHLKSHKVQMLVIPYDEAASIPLTLTTPYYLEPYSSSPHGAGFDAPVNPDTRG